MKRFVVVALVVVGLGMLGMANMRAQEGQVAKGTVASLAGDTLTVKVSGKDMVFTVDKATTVIARGAGTKAAQAAPTGGAKIGDLIKAGEGVEVHYTVKGTANYATMVRAGVDPSETPAAPKEPAQRVSGKATAVTNATLTVSADGKDYQFAITPATIVIGKGAGKLTSAKEAAGAKPVITDFVHVGDAVLVIYAMKGTTMEATEVRLYAPVK
jgi:hypothetical protein